MAQSKDTQINDINRAISFIHAYMHPMSDEPGEKRKLHCRDLAIQAMEKQIPKRVIYTADGYADGHLCYDYAECPNCGYDDYEDGLVGWEDPYCPKCGQALDWSMEESEDGSSD